MAAYQRKRRLSSASAFSFGLQEQRRDKRRDLGSPQCDFNLNSHVLLKWDDNGKRVLPKEEQIGISWRHLSSFVPTDTRSNAMLADVIELPREVLAVNDLTKVLSYEAWQSFLTEKERNFLMQLLPQGFEPDQVVKDLLAGDNFHFGNPSLTWGASLCSGDLHPDAIVQHEKFLKANKKAYYSELQQYHENMIRNLQKLKERFASLKDPESEILQMMSRSRRHAGNNILPNANGFKSHRLQDNVAFMSKSLVPSVDGKLCCSDNQKLSVGRDARLQKRTHCEHFMKDRHKKLTAISKSVNALLKPTKVQKLQKAYMNSNTGSRYMSYMKISKKQHELVKRMKQSDNSIQSKTLTRVLGNLDGSSVKPYEMFVEEEWKRIHEFWSNLANKDVPVTRQNWIDRKSKRRQIMNPLLHEMREKLRLLTGDERLVNYDLDLQAQEERLVNYDLVLQPQEEKLVNYDQEEKLVNCDVKLVSSHDEETEDPRDIDRESSEGASEQHQDYDSASHGSISGNEQPDLPYMHRQSLVNSFNIDEDFKPSFIENECSVQNETLNVNKEFHLSSIVNQSSTRNLLLNVNKEFNLMDLNVENNNVTSETSDTCSTLPEHCAALTATGACHTVPVSRSHISAGAPDAEGISCSSVKDVWTSVGLPESYHDTRTTQYASSSELSLRYPRVPDQPARLIDLKTALPKENATKDLLNSIPNHIPSFSSYLDADRNVLHSLVNRDNYHEIEEVKKTGVEFHPRTSVFSEPSQFLSHFQEQLQPSFALDNKQKAQNELFMNQNIRDSVYSGNRYSVQGQCHFSTPNVRDWSNANVSTPIQPFPSSLAELLNHNWFASENRTHGGWSGSYGRVLTSPSVGCGSGGDQSLYSVLSQCNSLHSRTLYNPVGSAGQIMPTTNYGQDMSGGITMTSNVLPQTASPFDCLSGSNAALKHTSLG